MQHGGNKMMQNTTEITIKRRAIDGYGQGTAAVHRKRNVRAQRQPRTTVGSTLLPLVVMVAYLTVVFLVVFCGRATCSSADILSIGRSKLGVAEVGPDGASVPATDTKFMHLPLHLFGLANRLRTLSCSHILARDASRVMVVDWQASPECNVTYPELFEPTPNHVLSLLDPSSSHARFAFRRIGTTFEWTLESSVPVITVNANSLNPRDVFAVLQSPKSDVALRSTGVFRPLHISCQEFFARRSAFYRALRPVDAVHRAVTSFYQQHMQFKLVIGAHIRVDGKHDYPVVPGDVPETWAKSSPVESIVRTLSQMMHHQKDAILFLASNSETVKRRVAALYPGRAVTFSPDAATLVSLGCPVQGGVLFGDRESTCGMRIALVEWFLLSKASIIVHPFWSSFAEEASVVNMTPRIMVRDTYSIAGFDMMKPHCGCYYDDPVALAAYDSEQASSVPSDASTEQFIATFDRSEDHEKAWGLADVYVLTRSMPK